MEKNFSQEDAEQTENRIPSVSSMHDAVSLSQHNEQIKSGIEAGVNSESSRTVSEVLRDLRHGGFRSGDGERQPSEITRSLFEQLANAVAKEGVPSWQPLIRSGLARLYRGEPVASDFPKDRPAVKLHALADQYGESGGLWFDLSEREARQYAGEDGIVYFVDVPVHSLIDYEAINFGVGLPGEFILPQSVVSEKRALPVPPQ